MLKTLLVPLIRSSGRELCRFNPGELQEAAERGWNLDRLNYKEFQAARAIAAAGHISLDEARFLADLTRLTSKDDPIIEVGTLFGYSTLVLAMNKHKDQQLITVDQYSWNPLGISEYAHELATRAVLQEACATQNVVMVRQDKADFYKSYRGPAPGMFFCDANHDYECTLEDLLWARKVGARIICGHDYDAQHHPGVVRAVTELGGPSEVSGSIFVL